MRKDNEPRIYGPYQHRGAWRLHYVRRVDGKRKTEYSTHATRAAAEAELVGARDEAQGVTVRAAIDLFLDKVRSKGREASTIENYEHRLWMVLGLPTNAERPIRWVLGRGADLYTATLTRKKGDAIVARAADTHISGLKVAKRWGRFCVKEKLLKKNPFEDVENVGRKAIGADKPQHTFDEARRLRDYCLSNRDIDSALTLGYLELGARASELVKRNVRDLDDDGWLLRIGKTKTAAGRRHLEISDDLREMLLDLVHGKAADAPIFVNLEGRRMSRHVARERVMQVCKAAEVPILTPQALRRTQSSMAFDAGAMGPVVARHLGQTSEAVTKRSYANPNTVRAAQGRRAFQVIAGGKR